MSRKWGSGEAVSEVLFSSFFLIDLFLDWRVGRNKEFLLSNGRTSKAPCLLAFSLLLTPRRTDTRTHRSHPARTFWLGRHAPKRRRVERRGAGASTRDKRKKYFFAKKKKTREDVRRSRRTAPQKCPIQSQRKQREAGVSSNHSKQVRQQHQQQRARARQRHLLEELPPGAPEKQHQAD